MDAVEIIADASMGNNSASHDVGAVTQSYSSSEHVIVHNDSMSSGSQQPHPHPAASSPQRSTQASVASSPSRSATATTESPLRSNPFEDARLVQQYAGNTTYAMPATPPHQQAPPPYIIDEDGVSTEPSTTTGMGDHGYTRSDMTSAATSTFGRLVESTKKRIDRKKKGGADDGESLEDDLVQGALIYGYLQKLGRNGKWQTRWFETDGECLTYYKSSKRQKLLATLDLAKVGSIVINHEDPNGCCFTINISKRPYHLRADSKPACRDWVITLNRVKEARMQEGNVKLFVTPEGGAQNPADLLDDGFTPRIVVVANRHRTRAVDDEEFSNWEHGYETNPAGSGDYPFNKQSNATRLARWQKSRNSLSRIANKLVRWAKSIRHSCQDAQNHVVLDHHVHPPGHDDAPKHLSTTSSPREKVGKGDGSVQSGNVSNLDADSVGHSVNKNTSPVVDEEELETRELS